MNATIGTALLLTTIAGLFTTIGSLLALIKEPGKGIMALSLWLL